MKEADVKKLNILNEDAAKMFIEIDDVIEADTGQSMLGNAKPFLIQILKESEGSHIPNAFSALLNARLTNKQRSASIGQ